MVTRWFWESVFRVRVTVSRHIASWRNWQTRELQDLVNRKVRVGSTPTDATMKSIDGTIISEEALHLSYSLGGAPKWWQHYLDLGLSKDVKSLDTAYHAYVKAEKSPDNNST
jgi:hypothetical protein